jgi:hypothetical protein
VRIELIENGRREGGIEMEVGRACRMLDGARAAAGASFSEFGVHFALMATVVQMVCMHSKCQNSEAKLALCAVFDASSNVKDVYMIQLGLVAPIARASLNIAKPREQ